MQNSPEAHEKYKAYQRELSKTDKAKERLRHHKRSKDPKYVRSRRTWMLRQKYGITADDYDVMLEAQGGGCAICGRRPGARPLHVDHCHETGIVRGILCHQCNWYLGTIEASNTVRENFLSYLGRIDAIKRGEIKQSEGHLRDKEGPALSSSNVRGSGNWRRNA
jgi:hypothetical protein